MAANLEIVVKTSEGKRIVNCPASWQAVSTELYQTIVQKWHADSSVESVVKLFALLTGDGELSIMQADSSVEAKIMQALSFVYYSEFDFAKLELPKSFTIEGKTVMIPTNIGNLSVGQNLLIRQRLAKDEDMRTNIAFAIAVYLQPLVTGKPVNLDDVLHVEKEIKTMCILNTYALGCFFLKRLKESGHQPQTLYLQTKRITNFMLNEMLLLKWLRLNCFLPIKTLIMLKNTL